MHPSQQLLCLRDRRLLLILDVGRGTARSRSALSHGRSHSHRALVREALGGDGARVTATSFDSARALAAKYPTAAAMVAELRAAGAAVRGGGARSG